MKKNLFANFTPKKAVAAVTLSALSLTLFAGYISHAFTAKNIDSIGSEKAKEIAFNHAGVSSSSVTVEKVELDRDDGVWEYEVDFRTSDTEYDYEINASTGAVIKAERESRKTAATTTSSASSNLISEDKAKEIAFNHAGVSSSSVTIEKVELDKDDGVWEYEIEFRVGRTEYEYKINASTGTILEAETDIDD